MNLSRMNRVRAIDLANNTITVEAGCMLQQVQEAAGAGGPAVPAVAGRRRQLRPSAATCPPMPAACRCCATATCASCAGPGGGAGRRPHLGRPARPAQGQHRLRPEAPVHRRRGHAGHHHRGGAEAVSAAARQRHGLGCGAPIPPPPWRCWRACASDCGERVTAFEIIGRPALELVLKHIPGHAAIRWSPAPPWQVLVELTDTLAGFDLAAHAGGGPRGGDGGRLRQRRRHRAERGPGAQALWHLRENISEAQKIEGVSIKHDISVPVSRIAEFIARADAALERALSRRAHRLLRPHRRRQPALQPVEAGGAGQCRFHRRRPRPSIASCMTWCMRLGGCISRRARPRAAEARGDPALQERGRDGSDARGQAGARSARPDESGQGALGNL